MSTFHLDDPRTHGSCTEEVSRYGQVEPCGGRAVAVRLDPTSHLPYPVCTRHARTPEQMICLADLINDATTRGRARERGL